MIILLNQTDKERSYNIATGKATSAHSGEVLPRVNVRGENAK